jgi:hypothetical protein
MVRPQSGPPTLYAHVGEVGGSRVTGGSADDDRCVLVSPRMGCQTVDSPA